MYLGLCQSGNKPELLRPQSPPISRHDLHHRRDRKTKSHYGTSPGAQHAEGMKKFFIYSAYKQRTTFLYPCIISSEAPLCDAIQAKTKSSVYSIVSGKTTRKPDIEGVEPHPRSPSEKN